MVYPKQLNFKSIIKRLIIFTILCVISFFIYDTYKYKFYNTENNITVLTYNCGNEIKIQPGLEQVAKVIEYAGKPDIIFLQDFSWVVKAPDLCKRLSYPYYATAKKQPAPVENLVILSKYPLSDDKKLIFYPEKKVKILSAIAIINQTKTLLCCVKLSSLSKAITKDDDSLSWTKLTKVLFKEYFSETQHTKSATTLLNYILNKKIENVIIGGDFNTTPFSKPIRMISENYKDSFRYSIKYFSGTRIKYFLKPRIDYIFTSDNFKIIRTHIVKKTYGDHYPVGLKLLLKNSD